MKKGQKSFKKLGLLNSFKRPFEPSQRKDD